MKKNYKYKFSVIIPIYNVEEYVEETIESIIDQSIGFKENIQIILVNDGSPDNSEEICLKYAKEYPENIKYIKKENGGVSSARNKGMDYIEGKYVNFLDSDDKWERTAFEKVYAFFEEHYKEIDSVSCPLEYFEAMTGMGHPLNYKFDENKIIDIHKDFNQVQLHAASSIYKSEVAKKHLFDSNLKYGEDIKYITEIILDKEQFGVVSNTSYLYRKRLSETSALQNRKPYDWYVKTPKFCFDYIEEYSKKKFGEVIKYVQYIVAYDYQWRIKELQPKDLEEKDYKTYVDQTKKLFSCIGPEAISLQRSIGPNYKLRLLEYAGHTDIFDKLVPGENEETGKPGLYYQDCEILNFGLRAFINLTAINFTSNEVQIIGFVNLYLPKENYKLNLVINNKKKYPLELNPTSISYGNFFGGNFMNKQGFKITIDSNNINDISFEIIYKDSKPMRVNYSCETNTKVDSISRNFYRYKNRLYYYKVDGIYSMKNNLKNRLYLKLRFLKTIIKKKRYGVLGYRFLYKLLKPFKRKEIWIISDRVEAANDNGMHMFKYVNSIKDPKIKAYFAISKKSADYKKMKEYGKVLDVDSFKYKLYFLLSKNIISSQAGINVYNPFGRNFRFYKDLYNFNLTFLQHGITKDDISSWLNIYDKNFKIFVCAAEREYESIVNGECYGFGKEVAKLTGFPRFDNLYDEQKKVIAFMPTWRKSIATEEKGGVREYSEEFKDSNYFKFYNDLINDQRIIDKMKEKGYKGVFVVHPSHIKNCKDFSGNDTIRVEDGFPDYQTIFRESNLLVSDYSSVPFDFAYLNKPVVYTQFDRVEFFGSHTYTEGYFDYEKDGFGPVVYNYEDTVKQIIKCLDNDCKLEKKYQNRINKFYKFHDRNNCQRVYEEIKKLK